MRFRVLRFAGRDLVSSFGPGLELWAQNPRGSPTSAVARCAMAQLSMKMQSPS